MAQSVQRVTSDGTLTSLIITMKFIKRSDLTVYIGGVATTDGWSWVGSTAEISFSPAVAYGVEVVVARRTPSSAAVHKFNSGAPYSLLAVDENFAQFLYLLQEVRDGFAPDVPGDVVGPTTAVDGALVVFDGDGNHIEQLGITGLLKVAAGVPAVAVADVDYTTPATTASVAAAAAAVADALRDIAGTAKTASYVLTLADRGQSIDTTANVVIPDNTTTAFPVGTTIMVTNTSASNITISVPSDTIRLAGTTTTGTRTIAAYGIAMLRKVSATVWYVSGPGVT